MEEVANNIMTPILSSFYKPGERKPMKLKKYSRKNLYITFSKLHILKIISNFGSFLAWNKS